MTPGKARLLAGIGCVGTLVVLAAVFLAFDIPHALFPAAIEGALREYCAILTFVTALAALMLPFDFIGGILIPAAYESRRHEFPLWLKQWSRSVSVLLLFFSITLFFYLQIGRAVGAPWLIVQFAVLQIGLVAGQELIWEAMAARLNDNSSNAITQFVQHSDPRFTGGITGLPGFESILVPSDWRTRLQPEWRNMLIRRRRAALKSGGRNRGIVVAMLWNICSFTAAVVASGAAMNSVADLVTVFLWFLLFSFVGLLLLPTLNRRAVFALDRHVAGKVNIDEFREAIREVDQLTERDPKRSASAESVFQPIPCPERRTQALSQVGPSEGSAWNVARTALFLSWAFGGPLARAVHCNVGRPELWAMMPTD